jgi:HrpA-like RNA helicase
LQEDKTLAGMDGAILVFLPGMKEIQRLYSQLQSNRHFYESDKVGVQCSALVDCALDVLRFHLSLH